jgi:tetratricopeptide (TPR) repeat protein
VAQLLLVLILLESCHNNNIFFHPPQPAKEIKSSSGHLLFQKSEGAMLIKQEGLTDKLQNSTDELQFSKNQSSTNPIDIKHLVAQKLTSVGWEPVSFYEEGGRLQVKAIEHHGNLSRPHKLSICIAQDIDLDQISRLRPKEQNKLIHILVAKNGQPGNVVIYKKGLMGGGKGKEKKEDEGEEELEEELLDSPREGNAPYEPEEGKQILSDYRPSDWDHLHYAVQAYQDTGGEVLEDQGWDLISTSPVKVKNSYFGSAYCNKDNKHIIIAHRGTQDKRDWMSNFDLITRHLNEQQASAWNFSKRIIGEHGPIYSYSFTGHSLGGWLALTSLYKYKDEFINSKKEGYQDAFAVTFDDPGGKELLEALQPRVERNYDVDVNKLDITSYLSYPNIVNTALGHVGSVYALHPEMNLSWLQRKTLLFTLKTHDTQLFLKSFYQNSGLPIQCVRVIDWPQVQWGFSSPSSGKTKGVLGYLTLAFKSWAKGEIQRGEYLGFYKYDTSSVNNPEKLPVEEQFQLQHGIHYRVEEFDEQKLPLRNMPEVGRSFLLQLSDYNNRISVIQEVVGEPVDQELAKLLENYRINAYHKEVVIDKCTSNTTARAFRDEILKYLKRYPFLYQKKLYVSYTESLLKKLETGMIVGVLDKLEEQLNNTKKLIHDLSFKQGTARLYKFIKPTWEEVEALKNEIDGLSKQLRILEIANIKVQSIPLESGLRTQLVDMLQGEEQQLKIAKQSAEILLKYMEEKLPEADSELDSLITTLNNEGIKLPDLDKKVLLNRAYNLKAKIAALRRDRDLSAAYYDQATKLLPNDVITWSNYGGLLTDRGRSEKTAEFHIQAYRCYKKAYPPMRQIGPEQLPVVCSGMAYGFILLAQSIEQNQIDPKQAKLPNVEELRSRAQSLLKQAIDADATYVNARLFSAILLYDQKNYEAALQEINNVLSIDPIHPTGLMRKGRILAKLGESDEAINFLEEAREWLQSKAGNEDWVKEIDKIITEIKAIQ